MRSNTPADIWAKVDVRGPDECWPWTGARHRAGYGAVHYEGRVWHAHRLVYTLFVGHIPVGLDACHTCDNPPCCNPLHLWVGTHADNNADKLRKGRGGIVGRQGEQNVNAKLSEDQVQDIRMTYATGRYTQQQIARVCRVDRRTVRRVVRGEGWQHLLPPHALTGLF